MKASLRFRINENKLAGVEDNMSELKEIVMPCLGMDSEQVYIAEWLINSGDKVSKGQTIAVLELDKTTMELESDFEGYLFITAKEEEVRLPGDVIAVITSENDSSIIDRYI